MRHPVFHFFALFILFFIDFLHFSDQAAFFLLFIALFDFAVTFLLFMVLTFFSLLYLFSPPPSLFLACFFLFLRTILRFSHLSTLFIPSLCFFTSYRYFFIAFSPFAASLTCFFAHTLLHLPLFNRFSPFLRLFLSFLLFFASSAFTPHFLPFFGFSPLFRFYLCHSLRLVFYVSHLSKCFT